MFNPKDMDAFLEWKAREGLKDRPGTFLEAVKKAKEGTRISVWLADRLRRRPWRRPKGGMK